MKAKTLKIVLFSVSGVLLAILIAANIVLSMFANTLISILSGADINNATRGAGEDLALQIAEEGTVLVKNDEGTLPLDAEEDTKISVFGWGATQWIMSGSGSGRATNGSALSPNTDFLKALTDAGIEYNEELIAMYKRYYGNARPYQTDTLHGYDYETCRLIEPNIETDTAYYTDELLSSAEENATAVVVLGRVSGESTDCPLVQYKGASVSSTPSDTTRTYLDISTEEEALLKYVGEHFEKVVVIINSTNAMNLGFLDSIVGLDACLVSGGLGNNATRGLVNVLYGQKMYEYKVVPDKDGNLVADPDFGKPVSPSGRLTDTYVYDFRTNSSFANTGTYGIGKYTNADGLYPIGEENGNFHDKPTFSQVSYLDYAEDIYVGYKWYETADAEGFWDSTYAKEHFDVSGYDEVVQYPFGYGLTYTEPFEWSIVENTVPSSIDPENVNNEYYIEVAVKNVGTVAAQEVVGLYYTPPYNNGGIEKSAVNLLAFGKTVTPVEPDGTQRIRLSFKLGDMGSYDAADKSGLMPDGGWILEAGEYTLSLRTDAHTVKEGVSQIHINCGDDLPNYDIEGASNLFTGDDAKDYGISVDGSNTGANITYLSRANKFADFIDVPVGTDRVVDRNKTREMDSKLKDINLYQKSHVDAWTTAQGNVEMPTLGAPKEYNLFGTLASDMSVDESKAGVYATEIGLALGSDYENELWEDVLDQLTKAEMTELALHGYIHEEPLPSVNKSKTNSFDGPSEYASFNVSNGVGVGYPNPSVLAQTWNPELSKSFGLAVAREGIESGVAGEERRGWYAPGVNLHRSAFGGRNYEYYSEDSRFSGIMAEKTVEGSLCAGMYVYIKHIIGYDQESSRDGLYCWMTEQALRETYLSPFKIIIDRTAEMKIGDETYHGTPGLMTAYGRVGAVWSGGSEALIQNLLRTEWNYQGAIITDYADHHNFMNGDQMIRAGGNLWMDGAGNNGTFTKETSSPAFVAKLRESTHQVLYTILNAQYIASNYNAESDNPIVATGGGAFPLWTYVGIVDAVLGAGIVAMVVIALLKKDKTAPADPGDAPAEPNGEPIGEASDKPEE